MKKTLIALIALAGVAGAFTDTIWDFENTTKTTSGINNTATLAPSTATTFSYADSGLVIGSTFGKYTLNESMGKAIDIDENTWIRTSGSAYWSNEEGKLTLGSGSQDFTLISYIKFDKVTGEQFIMGTGDSNEEGFALSMYGDDLRLTAKSQAHYTFTGTYTLSAGTWYNLAVSYSNGGTAKLFINGESVATITGLDKAAFDDAGGSALAIGSGCANSKQGAFAGEIAQLQILSGAKTQAEILSASKLVPEPTTATLSLLALAGLAARRRRK